METLESIERTLLFGVVAAGALWILAGLGTAFDAYMIATKQTGGYKIIIIIIIIIILSSVHCYPSRNSSLHQAAVSLSTTRDKAEITRHSRVCMVDSIGTDNCPRITLCCMRLLSKLKSCISPVES